MFIHSQELGKCLSDHYLLVCLDTQSYQICNEKKISHCVLIDHGHLPASSFNSGEYRYFTFLKHILLYEALFVAQETFYFDSDVLLLQNPWIETRYTRGQVDEHVYQPFALTHLDHSDHQHAGGAYDFMFQRDRGRTNNCQGSVNSGQMYIQSSQQTKAYLQRMFEVKEVIFEGKNGLDQDFVYNATTFTNISTCSLTPHLYTSHCYQVFGNIRYIALHTPITQIITYHVACVEGNKLKIANLKRVSEMIHSNLRGDHKHQHPPVIGSALRQ